MIALQNCQNTSKAKNSFYLNLRPNNPKKMFGKEANIWKLIFVDSPSSKKIYTLG
jgi:hypothetical protein